MSSAYPPNPFATPSTVLQPAPPRQEQGSNGLGIAGFICSLVGLCVLPILAPIGLALGLAALRRSPRGLAIAGVTIGAIGTVGWTLMIGLMLLFVRQGMGGGSFAAGFEALDDTSSIEYEVDRYLRINGSLPESLDQLSLTQDYLTDYWGNPYRYLPGTDSTLYKIFSNGPDGLPDTVDDLDVGPA